MKYCKNHVFVRKLSHFYVFFGLLTWVADQGLSRTVAFSRITSNILNFGTGSLTIIKRNVKAIFREYFSSLRFDSAKIFMIIIWVIFSRGPRATYCILRTKKLKAKLLFKILNKRTPEFLQDLFKPFTTEYDLRDKANKVALPNPSTELLKLYRLQWGPFVEQPCP